MAAASKKAPAPDARRDMEKELAAAAALKYQLTEALAGEPDLQLLHDMVEGETDLDSAIDKVLEQMALDVANVQGLERFETTLTARRKRLSDRVDTMRSMLLNALDILEVTSIDRPIARITRKPIPPKLVVINEAEIPANFFKQSDPVLSKVDLTKALKDRRSSLEGRLAELSGRIASGEVAESEAAALRDQLLADFPPIPGVELDNGGITIQVKWS